MDYFRGLFDVWSLLSFLAGVGGTVLYYRWRDHLLDKRDPANAPHRTRFRTVWFAAVVTTVVFSFVTAKAWIADENARESLALSQEIAADAKQTADENRECQRQFNEALRARAAITAENDRLSLMQRDALADWIHDLIFLPTDIAVLAQDDPRRVAYAIARTGEADRIIRAAQDEQRRNEIERKQHPYPEPTCGK